MPTQTITKAVSANDLKRQGQAGISYGPYSYTSLTRPTHDTLEVPSTDTWATRLGNRLDDVTYLYTAPSGI